MTTSETAAVVVNYGTAASTLAAVRSLLVSGMLPPRIVVIDNDSKDGSLDMLRRQLAGVGLIAAPINNGFAAGCNLGIRHAMGGDADRVLLLNSDATVDADCLGVMQDALETAPDLGIVGPKIVSSVGPGHVESIGIRYSRWTGRMRHLGSDRPETAVGQPDSHVVDGVSGCAMLIRREVFERVGLLREEYFFGFEDLDFCLRARAAGFRIACIGSATVRHHGSLTIGRRSGERIYFATRNHLLLATRFGPGAAPLRWARIVCVIALNLAHVLITSEVPKRAGLIGFLVGVKDWVASRFGRAPSSVSGKA